MRIPPLRGRPRYCVSCVEDSRVHVDQACRLWVGVCMLAREAGRREGMSVAARAGLSVPEAGTKAMSLFVSVLLLVVVPFRGRHDISVPECGYKKQTAVCPRCRSKSRRGPCIVASKAGRESLARDRSRKVSNLLSMNKRVWIPRIIDHHLLSPFLYPMAVLPRYSARGKQLNG